MYQPPRFFSKSTASAAVETNGTSSFLGEPAYALDNFFCTGESPYEGEWIVTLSTTGHLHCWNARSRDMLSPPIRAQLSFNELASGTNARLLKVQSLHLFQFESFDQPANTVGVNDPINLHGTICNAFDSGSAGGAAECFEGYLSTTRLDLLDGIICGAPFAFQYVAESGQKKAPRCFSMLLSGDRVEETNRGKDLVLAYPLLPLDVMTSSGSNESLLAQMLYEVLVLLKEDMKEEGVTNPLTTTTLPVPNRLDLEQSLVAQGYQINGDIATRTKRLTDNQFCQYLLGILGELVQDKLTLQPEGRVDEFIQIAKFSTTLLENWPPPSVAAVRKRTAHITTDIRSLLNNQKSPGDTLRKVFSRNKLF